MSCQPVLRGRDVALIFPPMAGNPPEKPWRAEPAVAPPGPWAVRGGGRDGPALDRTVLKDDIWQFPATVKQGRAAVGERPRNGRGLVGREGGVIQPKIHFPIRKDGYMSASL
jgi:hypothetical protein